MTTHGPIYQMVEEEIKRTKIKNWNGAGYMLQALEPLLPKIQELEPRWISSYEERFPNKEDNRNNMYLLLQNGHIVAGGHDGESRSHGFTIDDGDCGRSLEGDEDVYYWITLILPIPPTK